jgi:hypothetical protein
LKWLLEEAATDNTIYNKNTNDRAHCKNSVLWGCQNSHSSKVERPEIHVIMTGLSIIREKDISKHDVKMDYLQLGKKHL